MKLRTALPSSRLPIYLAAMLTLSSGGGCASSNSATSPAPLAPSGANSGASIESDASRTGGEPSSATKPADMPTKSVALLTEEGKSLDSAPRTAGGDANSSTGAPSAGDNEVMARLDEITITRRQLDELLIKSHGLTMLAKLAQLELAKRQATAQNIQITDRDIAEESQRYLRTLFNEDQDPVLRRLNEEVDAANKSNDQARITQTNDDLRKERERTLNQLLNRQKITRADFDLAMEINTYLRKLAEPKAKAQINDAAILEAFNQQYGEKVEVRDIAMLNITEVNQVKGLLGNAEDFAKVAREHSRNQETAPSGGLMPPFSRAAQLPDVFKDAAFSTKVGEISDPVAVAGGFHIIKVERRIPPRVQKFEDVKDSVRADLLERLIDVTVKDLRTLLLREVMNKLKIVEPTMNKQYQQQVVAADQELKETNDIRRDLDRRRQVIREQNGGGVVPTTVPSTAPSTMPTTAP